MLGYVRVLRPIPTVPPLQKLLLTLEPSQVRFFVSHYSHIEDVLFKATQSVGGTTTLGSVGASKITKQQNLEAYLRYVLYSIIIQGI